MSMKKIILSLLLIFNTSFLAPLTVLAVPATPSGAVNQTRLTNLKTRADREINRRINSLTQLQTRIKLIKRLTDTQKSTLTSQIQAEITSLTGLKTKIDADTDAIVLKSDVQSIVQSYRVYLLYIPQVHIFGAADSVLNLATSMSTLAGKLQFRINAAQTAGNNVSNLITYLTDMQAKITDAQIQANAAITLVTPLTPDGYPGNKPQLLSALKDLQTARLDLVAARQDGQKIIQGLHLLTVPKSATSSAKTATSSSTP